jgi:RHH-type proline utilization regulon transcriptional repressor/proline dehydrogenase/delta 1-pyrroline-5-carboxylate dehydrogenase
MTPALDARTRHIGRELFARLDRSGPLPLTRRWLDDQLMGLSMGNEALKVQLFRFVDTLPYLLDDPKEIRRHLREYLGGKDIGLPWWVRQGVKLLPGSGVAGRLLAAATRQNATQMARKFIAGSNVPEAVEAVRRMRADDLAFTIDLLGEATITEAEADHVQRQYLDLLTGLTNEVNTWPENPAIDRDDRGPLPRVNVSVKLSALYSQFDPIDPHGTLRGVAGRLRPILSLAKRTGAFVNFDMEQHSFKDTTLFIFRELLSEPEFRDWPDVGVAIQAYLTDTERDLQELLYWARDVRRTPVWIRLVKGAYWDYETVKAAQEGWPVPVYRQKWQSDAAFERCSRFLLSNIDHLVPAFGSHNMRSIAHALAVAEELKVPPKRFEFQMLYGMADAIKGAVQSAGHRVRIYTPYGELLPGMAYLVRRLLENTSNDSFLKQGLHDGLPEEVLLRDPSTLGASMSAATVHGTNGHPPPPRATDGGRFRNEPLADFALEVNRTAMAAALKNLKLGGDYPPVIANNPVTPPTFAESVNPSHSRQVVGRWGRASVHQANAAVAAALTAFDGWRDTPVEDRAALLRRAADGMRKRRWELAAWIVTEVGKPWREADADVAEAIDFCDYYAAEAVRLQSVRRGDVPGEGNEYLYEPRGVAVVIAPWNFPLAILCGMTAAAVATGNTAVMKPAEQSSVVGAKLMEVWLEAGVPPGVVNFLPGVGEEVGPVLTGHPDVALIAFTGSLPVALAINEQAARTPAGASHVKKVIAEMGGKNAVIVDSDADLDEAVKGVVDSAFGYAGQKCSAGSRAIVLAGVYDQFLNRLVEATKSLTVAPAESPGASLGPVIDADSQRRIAKFVEAGKREARLAFQYDLKELAGEGFYVGPTVFAEVPEAASIAQEEIFGPVLCVLKATDLDDALRIANGTKYALTGGVYSRSPEHIERVKRRFRVGNLYVNRKCTGALVDRHPFGGFKLSGIGSKAGGPDYLLQFVLPRTITENTLRRGFAPAAEGDAGPTGGVNAGGGAGL